MPSRRINNFPESRRGLGHVTLTIFGSTVGYPSDSLASCCTTSQCCHTILLHVNMPYFDKHLFASVRSAHLVIKNA